MGPGMMKIRPGAGAKYATVGDSSDMSELQTFRHYQISQDAQGAAVEVWRSGHEVACLVWDSVRGAFGELHVSIVAAERQMAHCRWRLRRHPFPQSRSRCGWCAPARARASAKRLKYW